MVGCESFTRSSISPAQSPVSLPMEFPPFSFSACKIRRRVGSAIACKKQSRFGVASGMIRKSNKKANPISALIYAQLWLIPPSLLKFVEDCQCYFCQPGVSHESEKNGNQ